MKKLLILLSLTLASSSYAGSSTYECYSEKAERFGYLKIMESFWTGNISFKWTFDSHKSLKEEKKIKLYDLQDMDEYETLRCLEKTSTFILFSDTTTYCFEKGLLVNQPDSGYFFYESKGDNLIGSASSFIGGKYHCKKM